MVSARSKLWILVLLLIALCTLRGIHLQADTPRELADIGVFVDEGYKTLDARNQVLFGTSNWHPADDYRGWAGRSPLTHWPYRAAFELLGTELWAARVTTILWFAAFLAAFVLGVHRRYSLALTVLGMLLLGSQYTLFFFSRSALLELPISVCLYGFLFLVSWRERWTGPALALGFFLALTTATYGIKYTAPVYFVPVAIGLLVCRSLREPRRALAELGALAAILALAGWLTRPVWQDRIDLDVLAAPARILKGSFKHSTGPLAALGLFCAFHGLWVRPRTFLENPYRAGLVGLVLLGPVLLGLYSYRPLRYYVPFMPAYVLLALEWLHLRTWREPLPVRSLSPASPVLLAVLTAFLFFLGSALHRHLLEPYVPGWTLPAGVPRVLVAAALAVTAAGLWFARRRFIGTPALVLFVALAVFSSSRDAQVLGRFFAGPTYGARDTARALSEALSPEASVAGDWAPLFTLGTPLRSLYSNPLINRHKRYAELKPDYFLLADEEPWADLSFTGSYRYLMVRGWLDPTPVVVSEYAGRHVSVFRLTYP